VPQYVLLSAVWQFPVASQQPLGQDVALQTHAPLTHACPAAQDTQAAPSVPHAALVGGLTQLEPLQQPLGQSDELQNGTHWPLSHC
jgi:hypothetical protein